MSLVENNPEWASIHLMILEKRVGRIKGKLQVANHAQALAAEGAPVEKDSEVLELEIKDLEKKQKEAEKELTKYENKVLNLTKF